MPKKNTITIELKPDQMTWLERMAASEGRTPENYLVKLFRAAYVSDPTRGGTITGGGSGKAKNFNPANESWSSG